MAIAAKKATPAVKPLSFVAKGSNPVLDEGTHAVKIISIAQKDAPDKAGKFMPDDKTPQLEVVFKDTESARQITAWYNLIGYEKNEDGTVKIDENTGHRIVSAENTEKALAIVGNLGAACGLDEGDEFSPNDLVGATLVINVAREQNSLGKMVSVVKYATKLEEVAA